MIRLLRPVSACIAATWACLAVGQPLTPAAADPPTDAEARQALTQGGVEERAVCYLSSVEFPFQPSGLALFSPDVAIAERLAKLGLLVQRQAAGSMQVRFDLTDAGRRAYRISGSERGFCAGRMRLADVVVGKTPAYPSTTEYRIVFVVRGEPDPRAQWAKSPQAAEQFPELGAMMRGAEVARGETRIARSGSRWIVVSRLRQL